MRYYYILPYIVPCHTRDCETKLHYIVAHHITLNGRHYIFVNCANERGSTNQRCKVGDTIGDGKNVHGGNDDEDDEDDNDNDIWWQWDGPMLMIMLISLGLTWVHWGLLRSCDELFGKGSISYNNITWMGKLFTISSSLLFWLRNVCLFIEDKWICLLDTCLNECVKQMMRLLKPTIFLFGI